MDTKKIILRWWTAAKSWITDNDIEDCGSNLNIHPDVQVTLSGEFIGDFQKINKLHSQYENKLEEYLATKIKGPFTIENWQFNDNGTMSVYADKYCSDEGMIIVINPGDLDDGTL